MVSAEVRIINKLGLHARPATKLVRTADSGKSEVFLTNKEHRINAKSILGVMMLQAEYGSILKIEVVGEDEALILEKLVRLVENRFEED